MVKLLSRTEHGTTAWSKLYWERFISCLVDVSGRALARLQLTGSGRSHVILQDTFAEMCMYGAVFNPFDRTISRAYRNVRHYVTPAAAYYPC